MPKNKKTNASANHVSKIKMARAMLTREEKRSHTPIFDSVAWKERRQTIVDRINKTNDKKSIVEKKNL